VLGNIFSDLRQKAKASCTISHYIQFYFIILDVKYKLHQHLFEEVRYTAHIKLYASIKLQQTTPIKVISQATSFTVNYIITYMMSEVSRYAIYDTRSVGVPQKILPVRFN